MFPWTKGAQGSECRTTKSTIFIGRGLPGYVFHTTNLTKGQPLPPIFVKVFQHSPRKIVSATQPPGGFSFATKYHEEVRMTTPSNGKSATETYFRNSNEGRANETTTSSALRHTSCGSDADGGSGGDGGGGGGGDGSNEDRVGPDDGFSSSNECVGADETSAMNAWQDERERHKQQRQRQRQQQQQPEHTGITGWNFYDRSNIAFRSRRLLAAYSGTGIGDPGGDGVSPRRAGNARSAKVTRFRYVYKVLCSEHVDTYILVTRPYGGYLYLCTVTRLSRRLCSDVSVFPQKMHDCHCKRPRNICT